MEMVEHQQTLTKKQKAMLAIEDYLDLVDGHKNLVDLTVRQLNQILGMHGFNKMTCQKKTLTEVVSRIQLMNFSRSTLQDDDVSSCGCLTLEEVIKGIKDIDWHECHITSLRTQNAASSASSAGSNDAVPVKKPKKARVAASTGTASSAGTNGAVSVKKPKKARVAATASSAGTNGAVSMKPKKVRIAASGTSVAVLSTTTGA
ncbi:unnamed protein product [Fraxinus pennsylvanica]|uniref:DUF7787 domain-containing protein n=1 Tax=Fraxinus pennsylvanica TaxID=56036 RepID=A0AAD2DX01_9LAMI|nr:unnamed protein product [Fraxinus pennsylvanica]